MKFGLLGTRLFEIKQLFINDKIQISCVVEVKLCDVKTNQPLCDGLTLFVTTRPVHGFARGHAPMRMTLCDKLMC